MCFVISFYLLLYILFLFKFFLNLILLYRIHGTYAFLQPAAIPSISSGIVKHVPNFLSSHRPSARHINVGTITHMLSWDINTIFFNAIPHSHTLMITHSLKILYRLYPFKQMLSIYFISQIFTLRYLMSRHFD